MCPICPLGCGHCKDLIPIYEEVAARFANEEGVVIAKFDSTENDQDHVTVKGFPTIYLFPANHKVFSPLHYHYFNYW